MSINGVERFSLDLPVSAAEADERMRSETAKMLAVFGAARFALSEEDTPSTQQIDALAWQIEELCTEQQGSNSHGIHMRQLTGNRKSRSDRPLNLGWNPAGILGGFGLDPVWDGAVASISNLSADRQWVRTGPGLPRRLHVTEGLYIPNNMSGPELATPMIRRTLWHPLGRHSAVYADMAATSNEVNNTSTVLQEFAMLDSASTRSPEIAKRPVYLEIGYGLDPAALRGRRTYRDKSYVGIDSAEGAYRNPIADYPDAVRMQSNNFTEYAMQKRPGEHISFTVGDARSLGLPPRSIREIFMANVINAPLDDEVRLKILDEASRILESDGDLVLRTNWHQDEWPESAMVDKLREHGFWVIRSVSHADTEYDRLEAQYGTSTQVTAPLGYYLIARPDNSRSTK